MTSKNFLVLLIIFSVSGFFVWKFTTEKAMEGDLSLKPNDKFEKREVVENKYAISNGNEKVVLIDGGHADFSGVISGSDKKDIAEWHENDVLTDEADNSDYVSYSDELLTNLSNSGDLKAMKILAIRYSEKSRKTSDLDQISEFMKKNAELVEKSIVYGDREFFGIIPEKSKAISQIASLGSAPEQKHQAIIKALAYSEFMALRGDFGAKYEEQKKLYTIYDISSSLTNEDKNAIKKKAKEIYDHYEAQRIQLGLGNFDNSVPAGKEKIFKTMRENYRQEMGNNAF